MPRTVRNSPLPDRHLPRPRPGRGAGVAAVAAAAVPGVGRYGRRYAHPRRVGGTGVARMASLHPLRHRTRLQAGFGLKAASTMYVPNNDARSTDATEVTSHKSRERRLSPACTCPTGRRRSTAGQSLKRADGRPQALVACEARRPAAVPRLGHRHRRRPRRVQLRRAGGRAALVGSGRASGGLFAARAGGAERWKASTPPTAPRPDASPPTATARATPTSASGPSRIGSTMACPAGRGWRSRS